MGDAIDKLKYAYEHSVMVSGPEMRKELGREFDKLIAEAQAVAWDEGKRATAIAAYELGRLTESNPNATENEMDALEPCNPYREGKRGAGD